MLAQYDDKPNVDRDWMKNYNFHLVDSIQKLSKLVEVCISRGLYSLDLETTGVDNRVYEDSYFDDGRSTKHGKRTVDRIVGVCISFDGKNGYYIPLSHEPEGSPNLPWQESWDLLETLVNSKARAIFHNAKFDTEFLYPVTGKETWKIDEYEDTFLIAKVINPLKGFPSGLKQLAKVHFGVDMIELEELFTPEMRAQLKREHRSTHNFGVLHPKEGLHYGASDGIFTFLLYGILKEKLADNDKKIYNLEKSFTNVLRKMERNRVHVDVKRVRELAAECDRELLHVGDLIRNCIESKTGNTGKWLTLNVGSPKQLSNALITDPEGLKLKPTALMLGENQENQGNNNSDDSDDDSDDSEAPGGTVKQFTLKDEALKSLHEAYGSKFQIVRPEIKDKNGNSKSDSIFDLIVEWRHYLKMKGSYVEPLSLAVDKNGDVRPDFRQMGTDTARLASRAGEIENGYSGINFQGIPRDSDDDKPELFKQIRSCIIPRPGYFLVKLDFAGEELRVVTNLSGDPIWTDSFLNKDGDVHAITARTLFAKDSVSKDERNRGKRCNFAFIYGGGAGAIQRNIGCSIEDAGRHMENLKRDVPVLMGYVDHQKAFARKNKCIYTAYGRRIPIPTIDSPIRAIRSKAERCAINYTIQATSADILKFAMCYVDKNIRAMGWDDKVKYVLTVHDEVVYEVKPELLMEAVRKLDEWMTMPWKLPKAHGRGWVVPLLTEPGIDINWKARYDYFKMVDGVPAQPKDIDENGGFKGKLKKDEYFEDGKIFQKVPDFLTGLVDRGLIGKTHDPITDSGSEPVNDGSVKQGDAVQHREVEPEKIPEDTTGDAVGGKRGEPADTTQLELSIDAGSPDEKSPAPHRTDQNASVERDSTHVHRFTIREALTERTVRKLHAICILAEGNTPLRVITPSGKVLLDESKCPRIQLPDFDVLARTFGIG